MEQSIWRYHIEEVDVGSGAYEAVEAARKLNELGDHGWELVSVIHYEWVEGHPRERWLFKRPVQNSFIAPLP